MLGINGFEHTRTNGLMIDRAKTSEIKEILEATPPKKKPSCRTGVDSRARDHATYGGGRAKIICHTLDR